MNYPMGFGWVVFYFLLSTFFIYGGYANFLEMRAFEKNGLNAEAVILSGYYRRNYRSYAYSQGNFESHVVFKDHSGTEREASLEIATEGKPTPSDFIGRKIAILYRMDNPDYVIMDKPINYRLTWFLTLLGVAGYGWLLWNQKPNLRKLRWL